MVKSAMCPRCRDIVSLLEQARSVTCTCGLIKIQAGFSIEGIYGEGVVILNTGTKFGIQDVSTFDRRMPRELTHTNELIRELRT